MKHLLDLSFYPPEEGRWLKSHSEFHALAREAGIDIRWIRLKPGEPIPEGLIEREIDSASGFVLRAPHFFHFDEGLSSVKQRIDCGVPLVVFFNRNHLLQQNDFLQEFGIEGTTLGLFANPGSPGAKHARDVQVVREEFPEAFRDMFLFNGVKSLHLDQVHAIRLHGAAVSLLSVPGGCALCVETKTDLVANWPAPEFSCVAGYYGRGDDKRKVLALHTNLLRDRFSGLFGHDHYGIEGGCNRVFAENLIQIVDQASPSTPSMDSASAHRLIDQVERNYYDFTRGLLGDLAADWWALVPVKVRESCARKRASEHDRLFSDDAYLDLLDYRTIWKDKWEIFRDPLASVGLTGGRNRALKYFHELNTIRKLIMHPTRSQSAGISITSVQAAFLDQEAQRSIRLWAIPNELT